MCGSIITTLQKDINDQESKIRAFILKGSGGKVGHSLVHRVCSAIKSYCRLSVRVAM